MLKQYIFEYKDALTKGKWHTQIGIAHSLEAVIAFYGLNTTGVEWRLISVKNLG